MKKQYILKPANNTFIIFSIIVAFIINIFPTYHNNIWLPDILIIVLSFWTVREPYKFSFTLTFILGVFIDVRYGSLLGQTSLIYILIVFGGILMQNRLWKFSFTIQALHFLPIFLLAYSILYFINYLQNQTTNNIFWLKPFIEIFIWPIIANILIIPQKLSDNIDYNRPI